MAFASSSEARIARVVETAFGITPATPTFITSRVTGGGLRTNKATATSDELRADRNVTDEAMVGQDVAGSYPFELSYGSFDDLFEGALFGAWNNNVLKNGVARKFFTFEETLELGATDSFSRFSGCMVNTMSLAIERRGKVTGSFGLMGQKETLASAIVTGATYTPASAEPIMNSSSHVLALNVSGAAAQPKVANLNFEVNNGLRTRAIVGSLYSEEFGAGRCEVTGTLEAYFESNELYQRVLDHGGGALSATIGAAANKKYAFLFPKIIFGDGARQIGGNGDDVMMSIPWRAVFDPAEACSIKITRAVA
ncbi:phage tail tube protein [Terrihabitans sp. B22-R8]|uniref:phage tail tube protein n=1 Tax=Terrihabitans sp. B22-R8 TaxID=3425128 RepID=UPI00403C1F8F